MSIRKGTTFINAFKTTVASDLVDLSITPSTSSQTFNHSGHDGYDEVTVSAVTSSIDNNIVAGNIKKDVTILGVTGTLESGGSGKNVQGYLGYADYRSATMGATAVTLTVAKTGTYKVSWIGTRNTSSGTSQSQLYINSTAYGSAQATFVGSYFQGVTLTGVSLTSGDVITVYAQARSSSYHMYVGNLIIEEQ